MEEQVILTADSKEALIKLIDQSIVEGYLIKNEAYIAEDGKPSQVMCLPVNIAFETKASAYLQIGFVAFFAVALAVFVI